MHYLDNSATTKPCQAAVEAAYSAMTGGFGNPSSQHGLGFAADSLLKSSRKDIAALLGCEPGELYFTSGGTEADNWAIIQGAELLRHQGRHIITTAVEHHAILEPVQRLKSQGWDVTILQPESDGSISPESLKNALRKDTVLVSVMMVNNETGAVNDIQAMAKVIKAAGSQALLHTDAVQGFMKLPFKFRSLGADMLSFSGHKVHALKGTGGLVVRKGLHIKPFILGGGQESGQRSGTENIPGIAALAAACRDQSATLKQDITHMAQLRDYALELIGRELPEATVLGAHKAPHIVNVALPKVRSQGLINCLQDREVYVSAGSACAKGKRSHVLTAMGVDGKLIDGSIRMSLCRENTKEDIEAFVSALQEAQARLTR